MHRIDNPKIRQTRIRDFPLDEDAWNDTNDFAEIIERGVSERSHEANAGAAIDNTDSSLG
jgi:hypothetical protein